jgi:hypothetical protein
MNNKQIKSSNATASAFGWDFKCNAAILMMIKNIETAIQLKVEGASEDIEITLENNKMLMSQVKAVIKPDDFKHVKDKMVDGLRSLNHAAKLPNIEKLLYVTNSPNPFNIENSMSLFSSPLNIKNFLELPDDCKKMVREICSENNFDFNPDLLMIWVIQFQGENNDERYKVLLDHTRDFLINFDDKQIVQQINTNQILDIWQKNFNYNSSKKTAVITKKSMIWPIIAFMSDVKDTDTNLAGYDDSDVIDIINQYKDIINNCNESFDFVTKICSDYIDFQINMKSTESIKNFIEENWHNYIDLFDLQSTDQSTLEILIRLILANILRSYQSISAVKAKVKL